MFITLTSEMDERPVDIKTYRIVAVTDDGIYRTIWIDCAADIVRIRVQETFDSIHDMIRQASN